MWFVLLLLIHPWTELESKTVVQRGAECGIEHSVYFQATISHSDHRDQLNWPSYIKLHCFCPNLAVCLWIKIFTTRWSNTQLCNIIPKCYWSNSFTNTWPAWLIAVYEQTEWYASSNCHRRNLLWLRQFHMNCSSELRNQHFDLCDVWECREESSWNQRKELLQKNELKLSRVS